MKAAQADIYVDIANPFFGAGTSVAASIMRAATDLRG